MKIKRSRRSSFMSYIPTPEQAEELVKRYNKEPFHIQHAETVSKVMGEFAKEYDSENVDFWRTVGMPQARKYGQSGSRRSSDGSISRSPRP